MKLKFLCIFTLMFISFSSIFTFGAEYEHITLNYDGTSHSYNEEKVHIVVDGKNLTNLSMPPIIFSGCTVVPAREVFESLGASVEWDKDNYNVIVNYNDKNVILKIGSMSALVDGNSVNMDIPARIINDKTMIPLRFVSSAIGLDVGWDKDLRIASISKPKIPEQSSNSQNVSSDIKNDIVSNVPDDNYYKSNVSINSITMPTVSDSCFYINADGVISDFEASLITNHRLIVDIKNSEMKLSQSEYSSTLSSVLKVRAGQNQTEPVMITRIVFDMFKDEQYDVYLSDDKKSIIVKFNNGQVIPPTVSSPSNQVYYDSANFKIVIKKDAPIDLNNVIHNDDYWNKKYTITFNGNYTSFLKNENIYIDDSYLNSVYVLSDENSTSFVFDEKQILAYNIDEDNSNVYIYAVLPKQKYKNIVVFDAGHGGSDQGAAGNGLLEKNLTLDIVRKVIDLLEQNDNIKGYATRLDDFYPSFSDRNDLGNAVGDAFVSVHINSATSTSANGTEVYWLNKNNAPSGLTSDILASTIHYNLLNSLGSLDRGIKSENFIVLRQSVVPAVLCEIGFISNSVEASKMGTDEYRQKAAEAIYKSLIELFEKYPSR